jgi:ribA/ribD-fused uncharacterized protein
MEKASSIIFDDKTTKYQCFLNSYPKDMVIGNKTFATVENYFYYKMYEDIDLSFAEDLRLGDVKGLKTAADTRKKELKDEWYTQRLNILFTAIRHKFEDSDLKKILLSTDNHYLEYNNRDSFFGNGQGGLGGCNILGKVLMEVRNELK